MKPKDIYEQMVGLGRDIRESEYTDYEWDTVLGWKHPPVPRTLVRVVLPKTRTGGALYVPPKSYGMTPAMEERIVYVAKRVRDGGKTGDIARELGITSPQVSRCKAILKKRQGLG